MFCGDHLHYLLEAPGVCVLSERSPPGYGNPEHQASPVIRLDPHIYLFTPLGVAEAHLFSMESNDTNALWVCFQQETKENWVWPSPMVRICESISGMRDDDYTDFHVTDAYFETLKPHILRHSRSPFYERAKGLV